ncbi:Mariner Mos1 transposase [Araneus ventricosus]|uniref:Mariner Mos1 transposase n=1 Tax=Araneus ventricosus TaxID=182803 RepID=A0A4Y2S0D3_ARAVE|nr:Mariner Mos1 transposase [Araneus ventricosus]
MKNESPSVMNLSKPHRKQKCAKKELMLSIRWDYNSYRNHPDIARSHPAYLSDGRCNSSSAEAGVLTAIKGNGPTPPRGGMHCHRQRVSPNYYCTHQGDWIGHEPLLRNQTINSDVYCQQLTKLVKAFKNKLPELAYRKGIMFLHDNGKPYTSLVTRRKLLELGWEVIYSLEYAPSNNHLFRSLQNFLSDKNLTNDEDLKSIWDQFFAEKDQKFYEHAILNLLEK